MWKFGHLLVVAVLAQTQAAQPQAPTPAAASQAPTEEYAGVDKRPPNAKNQKPARPDQTRAPEAKSNVAFDVVTVAEGLEKPWGMQFLPDGRMLVTEKAGRLRIVTADGTLSPPVEGVPPVDARNQGGLLDVLLARDYPTSHLIYWSFSEPHDGGFTNTAVAVGRLVDGATSRLEDVK